MASLLQKATEMQEFVKSLYQRNSEELSSEKDHVQFLEACLTFLQFHKETLKDRIYPDRQTSYGSMRENSGMMASNSLHSYRSISHKSKTMLQTIEPPTKSLREQHIGQNKRQSFDDGHQFSADSRGFVGSREGQSNTPKRPQVRFTSALVNRHIGYKDHTKFEINNQDQSHPVKKKKKNQFSGKVSFASPDHYVSLKFKETNSKFIQPSYDRSDYKRSNHKIQINVIQPSRTHAKFQNLVQNQPYDQQSNQRDQQTSSVYPKFQQSTLSQKETSVSQTMLDKITTPSRKTDKTSYSNMMVASIESTKPLRTATQPSAASVVDRIRSQHKLITPSSINNRQGKKVTSFIKNIVNAGRQFKEQ